MYRYRELNISGVRPFGARSVISFRGGLTCISGEGASGKTTISNALKGIVQSARLQHVGTLSPTVPDWIIGFDLSTRLPCGGEVWPPLNNLLASGQFPSLNRQRLELDITSNLKEMLQSKIRGFSKFSDLVKSPEQLKLKISDNGSLNVWDEKSGKNLYFHFQAAGERVVVYLAINKALRDQLIDEFDVPYIVDACLGLLDSSLLSQVFEFIAVLAPQVTVLERPWVYDQIGIKPDIEIKSDPDSNQSQIKLTT